MTKILISYKIFSYEEQKQVNMKKISAHLNNRIELRDTSIK